MKKSLGWFFMMGLACDGIAHAQLIGPYGTSPTTFEVDANGLLSASGTYGTGSLSLSGAGTRMFWYPGKAAFRAGKVTGTDWDDSNIGAYSVAFGLNNTASGEYCMAMGEGNNASGYEAVAMGVNSSASGAYSFAFGCSTTTGAGSAAIGNGCQAIADGAVALGEYSYASGLASTAIGYNGLANGYASFGGGYSGCAGGDLSVAFGYCTYADAYCDVVFGTYNSGYGNPTTWVSTDPLFELGNGTSSTPSDALVVYKNGNAAVQGILSAHTGMRVAPGGDLSMGSFTAGTAP